MSRQSFVTRATAIIATAFLAACGASVTPSDAGDASQTSDGNASDVGARPDEGPMFCTFPDGRRCNVGESCPAGDGCNTCRCESNGNLSCTLIGCAPVDAGAQGCTSSADCAQPGFQCIFAPGCDMPHGTCGQPAPCSEAQPFCGCDGNEYLSCEPTQPISNAGTCGSTGTLDCNPRNVTCRSLPPTCPMGQVPSVMNSCWGSCVPFAMCPPIPCMPGQPSSFCPAQTQCDFDTFRCEI